MLRSGDPVPDFSLINQFGEPVTRDALGNLRYVLVFYPFAFSGVCTSELRELAQSHRLFEEAGVRLYGVSVDHKFALREYAQRERLPFELLADFWPHGAAAQAFGCFDAVAGRAERATFFVEDARISHVLTSPVGQARSIQDYREALNWQNGQTPGMVERRKGL